MNIRAWTVLAATAALALALSAADVEWKYDDSKRPADDFAERAAVLGGEAPWVTAVFAVDAGAYCERVTGGCDFDSLPVGCVIIVR